MEETYITVSLNATQNQKHPTAAEIVMRNYDSESHGTWNSKVQPQNNNNQEINVKNIRINRIITLETSKVCINQDNA